MPRVGSRGVASAQIEAGHAVILCRPGYLVADQQTIRAQRIPAAIYILAAQMAGFAAPLVPPGGVYLELYSVIIAAARLLRLTDIEQLGIPHKPVPFAEGLDRHCVRQAQPAGFRHFQ